MSADLWLCPVAWRESLRAELNVALPQGRLETTPVGLLYRQNDLSPAALDPQSSGGRTSASFPAIALAEQVLPHATAVAATSISGWAQLLADALIARLADHQGPWRLHAFSGLSSASSDPSTSPSQKRAASQTAAPAKPTGRRQATSGSARPGQRRCQLVVAALEERLRQKQRRLIRSWQRDAQAPWLAEEWLVQWLLTSPGNGYWSVATAAERTLWRRNLSRQIGGSWPLASDRAAPSRAFAKLAEALGRLQCSFAPGQACVDLGASPGSWTWLALRAGAQVVAVDRAELRVDLMQDSRLTFVRGDAFRYEPAAPVDWLLCDVIAFPQRSLELLERWLASRWCRRFCLTIKFRGAPDVAVLQQARQLLERSSYEYVLRRLSANQNEVTAYGAWADAAPPARNADAAWSVAAGIC